MAGVELSEEVLAAYSELSHHEDLQALSFVFKIKDSEVGGKKITWRDFHRLPNDENCRYLFQGHVVDLDRAPEEGGAEASLLDTKTKHLAAVAVACAKSALFEVFKARGTDPSSIHWFYQVEHGPLTGLHIHLVIGGPGFISATGKWVLRILRSQWARWLVASCDVNLTPAERLSFRDLIHGGNWVSLFTYKHRQTGKEYCKPVNWGQVIMTYFMSKVPYTVNQENFYIYSWDNKNLVNDLNHSERMAIHKMYVRDVEARKPKAEDKVDSSSTEPQSKKKRQVTQRELNAKEIVDILTKYRVVTMEQWMSRDPDSYVRAITSPGGQQLALNLLEISGLKVSSSFTAYQLIVEKGTETCRLSETKQWLIFAKNNFNPLKCLHAVACCLNRQSGKRNTVLFDGPATTGKSILAQSLCAEVENVGCYNPANVNFPFNDCVHKNIIWVEECPNLGQQVNQFKCIMSGQTVRVDQKGKGSKPIAPTPVIMTSNEDVSTVRVGCELRPEHTQPIQDRVIRFTLREKLEGDFGLIQHGSWGQIFRTMEQLGYQPTMASYSAAWQTLPTWGENWGDPAIKDPQDDETDTELQELLDAFSADARAAFNESPDQATGQPIVGGLVADYASWGSLSEETFAGLPQEVSRQCLAVSHFLFTMGWLCVTTLVWLTLIFFLQCLILWLLYTRLSRPIFPQIKAWKLTKQPTHEPSDPELDSVHTEDPSLSSFSLTLLHAPFNNINNPNYLECWNPDNGDYACVGIFPQDSHSQGTDTSDQATA